MYYKLLKLDNVSTLIYYAKHYITKSEKLFSLLCVLNFIRFFFKFTLCVAFVS
jgi:hypothetical protein